MVGGREEHIYEIKKKLEWGSSSRTKREEKITWGETNKPELSYMKDVWK